MRSIHINTVQAGKIIGLEGALGYDMAKRLGIPCEHVGRSVIFNRAAVEQWFAEHPTWRTRHHKHHNGGAADANVRIIAERLTRLEQNVEKLVKVWLEDAKK